MSDPLRGLLDERAIVAVGLRYARALDTRDWDLLAGCFQPDARWGARDTTVEGRAAIRAKAAAALSDLDATQHVTTNFEVTLDDDRAAMRSYFVATHMRRGADGTEARFVVAGTYVDAFVLTSDGWQIARRTIHPMWSSGEQALLGDHAPATTPPT